MLHKALIHTTDQQVSSSEESPQWKHTPRQEQRYKIFEHGFLYARFLFQGHSTKKEGKF